jgi:hypothetical protein
MRMNKSRQRGGQVVRLALASLAWVTFAGMTGCSRQLAVPASGGTAGSAHLPFDRVSNGGGISPTAGFAFDGPPAGTEIVVRLQAALSSADSRVGDAFAAVVDEPVIVAGKIVVPQGAIVTGNVMAARASRSLHEPGYLRVTLTSMVVNGKAVPLRTSSIFAKGGSYAKRGARAMKTSGENDNGAPAQSAADSTNGGALPNQAASSPLLGPGQRDVRFSTGRRLTFRLAQPLHLES